MMLKASATARIPLRGESEKEGTLDHERAGQVA